jgi:hypothetical protein
VQLAVARSKNRQDPKRSKVKQYVARCKTGCKGYIKVFWYSTFADMVKPCEHKFETSVCTEQKRCANLKCCGSGISAFFDHWIQDPDPG